MGMNLTLEDLVMVIKIFHEECKCIFIICEFVFGILESINLSIAQ